MDGLIDAISTRMAQASSRRGFIVGMLRTAIGCGIGLCFVGSAASGLAAVPLGCGGLGVGGGNNTVNGQKGCAKPYGSGSGSTGATNCHWDAPGGTYGDSDKYGCRPRTGGSNPRPYCQDIGQTCGNTSGTGPPTCPSNYTDVGYWSCCCSPGLPNNGSSGTTLTICLDCDLGSSKCICLKVMPDAKQCGGTIQY
jgi:hypothetical protein